MKLVISDTNIIIDLLNIDLLDIFLQLPIEIHTTDLVVSELKDEQAKLIMKKVTEGKMLLNTANEEEYAEILEISKEKQSISLVDFSVYYFANKIKATILTGDKAFRNYNMIQTIYTKKRLYCYFVGKLSTVIFDPPSE